MDPVPVLLTLADAYCAESGRSCAAVSKLIFNDGKVLRRLRLGGQVFWATAQRGISWFSEHWPPGAEWPAGIERPPPGDAAWQAPRRPKRRAA